MNARPVVDPLFFATPKVDTFAGEQALTNASGFFFRRGEQLFLVTSRHVLVDEDSGHHPDRIEIALHLDPQNLTQCTAFAIALFNEGTAVWRQGQDSGGDIDVAVIELDQAAMPANALVYPFTPEHLVRDFDTVPVDANLFIVGFPLGFQDTVHQLPVLRRAAMASPFGIRFQGQGLFLTDGRAHRGISGAPVVMRDPAPRAGTVALPWRLLGVHSSRMDMGNRDRELDESLGLNCAWYADILLTLTEAPPAPAPADAPAAGA
jgi:hypothetical protein